MAFRMPQKQAPAVAAVATAAVPVAPPPPPGQTDLGFHVRGGALGVYGK